MRMKVVGFALSALLFALSCLVEAQQAGKVHRIGYLSNGTRSIKIFRHSLRELGYIEGQNIVIEGRFAKGKLDRFPGFVAELMRLKTDIIVVTSVQGSLAVKKATQTIPIVFAIAQNPVGVGLVTSLAQPGGNVTGLTDFARELAGKRLELPGACVFHFERLGEETFRPDRVWTGLE